MKFLSIFFLSAAVTISSAADLDSVAKNVVQNYANLVHANYQDSFAAAQRLQTSIRDLLAERNAETLAAAREAWVEARKPYLQTEVFRFYDGPIDDEDGPEGLLNAWPMDEAYVDYVVGNPTAGVINNLAEFPEISQELLTELNEKDGEENITSGFHAIEFLLWGQDLSAEGPGERPVSDFDTADNADRRRIYLLAAMLNLEDDLIGLIGEWEPESPENYRASFTSDDPKISLRKILTGMSMLSGFELSGERLLVALETRAQEDEHSCFSDTTHLDAIYDALGIVNVWHGRYGEVSGPGVKAVAEIVDPKLAEKLGAKIELAHQLAGEIPAPFDQAILSDEGRGAIMKLVETLEDQAELIVELSQNLGFEVPTSEAE